MCFFYNFALTLRRRYYNALCKTLLVFIEFFVIIYTFFLVFSSFFVSKPQTKLSLDCY